MFILNRGNPDTNRGTSFIEFGPKKETFGANPPDFEVKVKFEETARLLIARGYSPVNEAAEELVKPRKSEDVVVTAEVGDEDVEDSPKKVLPRPKK
jgi:hypothetical protein